MKKKPNAKLKAVPAAATPRAQGAEPKPGPARAPPAAAKAFAPSPRTAGLIKALSKAFAFDVQQLLADEGVDPRLVTVDANIRIGPKT